QVESPRKRVLFLTHRARVVDHEQDIELLVANHLRIRQRRAKRQLGPSDNVFQRGAFGGACRDRGRERDDDGLTHGASERKRHSPTKTAHSWNPIPRRSPSHGPSMARDSLSMALAAVAFPRTAIIAHPPSADSSPTNAPVVHDT